MYSLLPNWRLEEQDNYFVLTSWDLAAVCLGSDGIPGCFSSLSSLSEAKGMA